MTAANEYFDRVMYAGISTDVDTPLVELPKDDDARRLVREGRFMEILTGLLDIDF
jgi:hypothetical protein